MFTHRSAPANRRLTRRQLLLGLSASAAAFAAAACSQPAPPPPAAKSAPATTEAAKPTAAPAGQAPAPTAAAAKPTTAPAAAAPAAPAAAKPAAAPTPGSTLVMNWPTEPGNMHPLFRYSSTIFYARTFLFGGLGRVDPEGKLIPHIAESWTASPDGMNWKFTLRKDVKFQDGTPLTARDVKATFDTLAHPDYAGEMFGNVAAIRGARDARAGKAEGIAGVKAVDDYTVEIELAEAYAPFGHRTVAGVDIVPAQSVKDGPVKDLLNNPFARTPIGVGPYRLAEWKPKESITLKAFPGHFAGSPSIETIIVRWVPGAAPSLADLKAGSTSFIGLFATTPPDEFDNLSRDYQTFQYPAFTVHEIELDLTKPYLADKRVRQAMVHAMDREAIAKKLWNGKARVAYGPIHPLHWSYQQPKTTLPYDPARAKQLLTEAGWTPGPDGIVQKDGQPLSFTINAQIGHPEKTAIAVQDMLKAVGIDAKVVPTEVNNIVSEIRKPGQFQGIATHSVGSIYPDPDDLLIRFSSRSEPRINSATYKSERYDAAYDRSLREMDQAARKEALIEVGEVLADEQPRLFVVWLDDLYVVSKKVIIPDGIKGGYEFMASIPRWQLRP